MRARRRVTAHDVKRRLMRKLLDLPAHEVARIVAQLREFALAKNFFAGESFESLTRNESLGCVVWTRDRVERAVRNNARAAS